LLLPIRTRFTEKRIQNLSKEVENVLTKIKPPIIIILEKSLTWQIFTQTSRDKRKKKSNERRENGRQFKSHITTTLKNNTRTSHRRPKKFGRNNPSWLPDPLDLRWMMSFATPLYSWEGWRGLYFSYLISNFFIP